MEPAEDEIFPLDTLAQELKLICLNDTATQNSADEVFPFDALPHELQLLCLKDIKDAATLNLLRSASRRFHHLVDNNGYYRRVATIQVHQDKASATLEEDSPYKIEIEFPAIKYWVYFNSGISTEIGTNRFYISRNGEATKSVDVDHATMDETMQLILRGTVKRKLIIFGKLNEELLESLQYLVNVATEWAFRCSFDGVTEKNIMQIEPQRPLGIHGGYKITDIEPFVRDAGIRDLRFSISNEATLSNENLHLLTMRDDLDLITVANVRGPGPATIRKLIEDQLNHFPTSNRMISLTFRHDVSEYSRDNALRKNGNGVTVRLIKNANICTMLNFETSKAKLRLRILLRTLELELGKANKKF